MSDPDRRGLAALAGADSAGLHAVMWLIALLPVAGLAIALTLPPTPAERTPRTMRLQNAT